MIAVAAAGAAVGLVAGGLGNGAFAGGAAPWAPPTVAVTFAGAGYVAASQVRGNSHTDTVHRPGDEMCPVMREGPLFVLS